MVTDSASTCDLTVLVLTLNEERHIERCLSSVKGWAERVVVVDSNSSDRTREIAAALGADVYIHPFINHARQFNWGLDNTNIRTQWVMRLDADEYITPGLAEKLPSTLSAAEAETSGYTLNLRRVFMGKWLRHGALYPISLLRVFRAGKGRCEERWMDEHVAVQGHVKHIDADFADHNLNSITWWTDKHNRYASREAADLLLLSQSESTQVVMSGYISRSARMKRWIKTRVYSRLPLGLRAQLYFLYRYFLRLGFLDGWQGLVFHVLQGFWYRFLVDVKVAEVERHMRATGCALPEAIEQVLNIKVAAAA